MAGIRQPKISVLPPNGFVCRFPSAAQSACANIHRRLQLFVEVPPLGRSVGEINLRHEFLGDTGVHRLSSLQDLRFVKDRSREGAADQARFTTSQRYNSTMARSRQGNWRDRNPVGGGRVPLRKGRVCRHAGFSSAISVLARENKHQPGNDGHGCHHCQSPQQHFSEEPVCVPLATICHHERTDS